MTADRHPNTELIVGFYRAFAARDADAMATAYAPDATFSDPVFESLRGEEIGAMWKMLCSRATDLRIEANRIGANETSGRAHWEAWYPFGRTGRLVHNVIEAEFEFRDGRIVRHVDRFDFWRWSGMALGTAGKLLGWTPMLRNKVRAEARRGLDRFIEAERARG